MKVYIDGRQADTDERTEVSITLSVASQSSLEASKMGYSKTILIPMTVNNQTLLGMPEDLNAWENFNCSTHTARIEKEGCTVIEGVPRLTESVCSERGYYKLNIIGAGREWVEMASKTVLRNLGITFNEKFSAENIVGSWTWTKPVRFLPVHRPGLEPQNISNNIVPPMRTLTADDYHPFLHLATIFRQIFSRAGYTLQSDFAYGTLFNSLYISGNYPSQNTSSIRSRVDFKAGRTTEVTAAADRLGRAYATPATTTNSLGNIVDTTDPAKNTGGVTAAGVFTYGGCFRMHQDGHMEFKPTSAVTVAFEYNIVYRTQYQLDATTGALKGFDRIYIGSGNEYRFALKLPWPDLKSGVLPSGHSYRIFVYGHQTGDKYRLQFAQITNTQADPDNLKTSDYQTITSTFTTMPTLFSTGSYARTKLVLTVQKSGTSSYVAVADQAWGVYDSGLPTSGEMEVEVTLRTQAFDVTPNTPKTFDDIYFGGADQGMTMTLLPGTTLRPVFIYGATEGETLNYVDVAAHDNVSCLDVVRACKQMFNLYFFTDRRNRMVFVEPRDTFYLNEPVVDLTSRIDHSQPIVVSDPGAEVSKIMTFCYAAGDEAVGEFNREQTNNLGIWSTTMSSVLAQEGEKKYTNPLFAPSVNSTGAYTRAAAASMLRVGSTHDPDEINFPMKIVRYAGVQTLPSGQMWGWPGNQAKYPLAAFYETQNKISLSFESRSGIGGLNSYWTKNIAQLNGGRRLQLYIDLRADDIEALVCPNDLRRDFRALYRLTIGGESALYRLEEVADYNPATQRSTKCTFIKE